MVAKYGFVSEVFEYYAAAIASVDEFTMTVRPHCFALIRFALI